MTCAVVGLRRPVRRRLDPTPVPWRWGRLTKGRWGLILVGVAWLAGCGRTQIVVVSDTDLDVPAELDAFVLEAEQAGRSAVTQRYALSGVASIDRPVVTGFVPGAGVDDASVRFTLTGLRDGGVVLTRTVQTQFEPGEVRRLDLRLLARCLSPACASETCEGCGVESIPPQSLPRWPDPPPDAATRDAGRDGGPTDASTPDAGPDASFDAGPVDAGPVDAGSVDAGPVDGGSVDGGPVDGGPPPVLLVEYDFETAGNPTVDTSGAARDAVCRTVAAAPSCPATDAESRIGASSGDFNGTQGQVLPYSADLSLAESGFTFEAWLRPNEPLNAGEINTVARLDRAFGFRVFLRDDDGTSPRIFFTIEGLVSQTTTFAPLPGFGWTHLTARWADGTMSLFVDGVLAMSQAQPDLRQRGGVDDGLHVGFGVDGAAMDGAGYQGRLDRVRLYRGGLSDETILSHAAP